MMAGFRAMFLALLIANAGIAASQQQSRIVVGVGKLPALAAFMYMARGEEASSSEADQLVQATSETEGEEELAYYEESDDAKVTGEEVEGDDDEEGSEENESDDAKEAGKEVEGEDDEEGSEEDEEEGEEEGEEEDDEEEEDEEEEEDNDDQEAKEEDAKKTFDPKAVIEKFDADKDGMLSVSEVKADEVKNDKTMELATVFASSDQNKDSKLDTDELAAFVQGLSKVGVNFGAAEGEEAEDQDEEEEEDDREQIGEPMQMMQDLDTDKDGKLTLKELVASEEDVNGHEEDIAVVFETNDKNKDGRLDLQELNVTIQDLEKKGL